MTQSAQLKQDEEVASPCVKVCKMNEATCLCEGCKRSIDEIACWSIYTADEKRAVLAQLPARKQSP